MRRTLWVAMGPVALAVLAATAALLLLPNDAVPGVIGVIEGSGPVRGTEVTVNSKIGGLAEVVPVREGQRVAKLASVADISLEYALGFGFGWSIFQALFMRDMAGGSYWHARQFFFFRSCCP